MGTHPIFESDFDCLTEFCFRKYGDFAEKRFYVKERQQWFSHDHNYRKKIFFRETAPERVVITARLPEVEIEQPRRRVMFTEDTVDNEGLGRKSTKVCCIYHKPKLFGESSSESYSSDDDISPLERKPKQMKKKKTNKCAEKCDSSKCDS